jgi:hypothetical protein
VGGLEEKEAVIVMVVRGGKEAIGYGRGGLNRDCSYECIYRFYFAITSYRGDNIVTVGNRQEARGRLYQYHNYYSQSRLPELPFFRYYSFPRIPVDLFAFQSFFLGCPWGCSTLFNLSPPSPLPSTGHFSLFHSFPFYERFTLSTLTLLGVASFFVSLFLGLHPPIQHGCFRLAQEPSPPALVSE